MSQRKISGYRGPRSEQPSSPEYLDAFKEAVQKRQEHVRRVQELRRSSAAGPVKRDLPRSADRRRAIKEQDNL